MSAMEDGPEIDITMSSVVDRKSECARCHQEFDLSILRKATCKGKPILLCEKDFRYSLTKSSTKVWSQGGSRTGTGKLYKTLMPFDNSYNYIYSKRCCQAAFR